MAITLAWDTLSGCGSDNCPVEPVFPRENANDIRLSTRPPVSAPPIPRVLVAGEYLALAMTFLALFGCLAALLIYTGDSLWQGTAVQAPAFKETKEYYAKEIHRQHARTEYRAAVTQSTAYLAGTAVGFLAVALFLIHKPGKTVRFARS